MTDGIQITSRRCTYSLKFKTAPAFINKVLKSNENQNQMRDVESLIINNIAELSSNSTATV